MTSSFTRLGLLLAVALGVLNLPAAAQEVQPDTIPPGAAVALSAAGTVVPVLGAFLGAHSGVDAPAAGYLFLGGVTLGPALGYVYAGHGERGFAGAAARTAILFGGIALSEDCAACGGVVAVGLLAAVLFDLAHLSNVVAAENEARREWSHRVQPTVDPSTGAAGVRVEVRW